MKLKKFKAYTDSLLPHEVILLNRVKQFQDQGREDIFNTIYHNVCSGEPPKEYNSKIDKRKYSHLMKQAKMRLYQRFYFLIWNISQLALPDYL